MKVLAAGASVLLAVALAPAPCRAASPGVPPGKTVPCAPVLDCSVAASSNAACRVTLTGPACGNASTVEVTWSRVRVVPATRSSGPDLVVVPVARERLDLRPEGRPGGTREVTLGDGVDHEVAAAVRSAGGAVLGTTRLYLVPSGRGTAVHANHPVIEETPIRVRQVRFGKRGGPP